ncbi:hypothetical protein CJ468_06477 [Nocardia farcinica]|nr:hypothetical protein CJ468_06477 [Nocardia farcinica]
MDLASLVRAFCHPVPKPLVYVEPTILWSVQW